MIRCCVPKRDARGKRGHDNGETDFMPLIQSIDSALEKNVGSHGIADAALKSALDRAEAAPAWLRARYADGGLPLLRLAGKHADLRPVIDAGRRLADRATDIVLLGTGGSSLGGQTLSQ